MIYILVESELQSRAKMNPVYDYLFKVMVTGDVGTGRNSIVSRFADDTFNHSNRQEVDFKMRTLNVDGKVVKTQIFVAKSQKRLRTIMATQGYRGANAIIITYDTTDKVSFLNLEQWLVDVERYACENVLVVIVGTKIDMTSIQSVDQQTANKFANERGLIHLRTSAKTGEGIDTVFTTIANALLSKISKDSTFDSTEDVKPSPIVALRRPSRLALTTKFQNWLNNQRSIGRCGYTGWGVLYIVLATVLLLCFTWCNLSLSIKDEPVIGIFLPRHQYDCSELRVAISEMGMTLYKTSMHCLISSPELIGSSSLTVVDGLREKMEAVVTRYGGHILFQKVGEAWLV